jgi:hypothetical protein
MGPKLNLNADAETMEYITLFFSDDITEANSYVGEQIIKLQQRLKSVLTE